MHPGVIHVFFVAAGILALSCKARRSSLMGARDSLEEQMAKPEAGQILLSPGPGYDLLPSDRRSFLENRLQTVVSSKQWSKDILVSEDKTGDAAIHEYKLTAQFKLDMGKRVSLSWKVPAVALFAAPNATRFLLVAFEENMFASTEFRSRNFLSEQVAAKFFENGLFFKPEASLPVDQAALPHGLLDRVPQTVLQGYRADAVVTILNSKGPNQSAIDLATGSLFLMTRDGQAEASAFGVWQGLTVSPSRLKELKVNALSLATLDDDSRDNYKTLTDALAHSEKVVLESTSVTELAVTPAIRGGELIVGGFNYDLKEAVARSVEEYQALLKQAPLAKKSKGVPTAGGNAGVGTPSTSPAFKGHSIWTFEQIQSDRGEIWRIVVVASLPDKSDVPRKVEMIRIFKTRPYEKSREYEYISFSKLSLEETREAQGYLTEAEVVEAESMFNKITFKRFTNQKNLCQVEYTGDASLWKGTKVHFIKKVSVHE